jgi:hypothetical protein
MPDVDFTQFDHPHEHEHEHEETATAGAKPSSLDTELKWD